MKHSVAQATLEFSPQVHNTFHSRFSAAFLMRVQSQQRHGVDALVFLDGQRGPGVPLLSLKT